MSGHQTLKRSAAKAPAGGGQVGQRSTGERGTEHAATAARPGALHAAGPAVGLPLVQTKVEIGASNDPYEREADAVADRVAGGGAVPTLSTVPASGLGAAQTKPAVQQQEEQVAQTKAAAEEEKKQAVQAKEQAEDEKQAAIAKVDASREQQKAAKAQTEVQKEQEKQKQQPVQTKVAPGQEEKKAAPATGPAKQQQQKPTAASGPAKQQQQKPATATGPAKQEEKKPVQTKADGGGGATSGAQAAANQAISSKGAGDAMAPGTRRTLEPAFGADLSHVRVHEGAQAQEAASAMGARAFAHGSDIWLGKGESQSDVRLMAHETAHVFQQGSAVRRLPTTSAGGGGGAAPRGTPTGHLENGEIIFDRLPMPDYKVTGAAGHLPFHRNKGYNDESREDTNQRRVWRDDVDNTASQTRLNQLVQAAFHQPVVASRVYNFEAPGEGGKRVFRGRIPTIAKNLTLPSWDKSDRPHNFDVDHIVELQLSNWPAADAAWANTKENMQLLDSSANRSSGSTIKNNINTKVDGFINAPTTAEADKANPKGTFDLLFERGQPNGTRLGQNDVWTKEQIEAGNHLGPVRVAGEEREGVIYIFTSEETEVGREFHGGPTAAAVTPQERDWLAPFKIQAKQFITEGDGVESTPNFGSFTIAIPAGDPKWKPFGPQVLPIKRVPEARYAGYIDKSALQAAAAQLQQKDLSPVQLTSFDVLPEGGILARGQIISDLPLLRNAGLGFQLRGRDLMIYKEFNIGEFQVPRPFTISRSSLVVALGTESGLTVGGAVEFAIDRVGRGSLRGAVSTATGFGLAGDFNFDSELFDPASIALRYENQQFSGEGHLGIRPGRVKGIRSGSVDVTYSAGNLAATGTVAPAIPGVREGQLSIGYNDTEGLTIGGTLQLGDIPGVRSGTLEARVQRSPAGTYAVSAQGTAQPAIPGINSELRVAYDNGVFTAEATAAYGRGMLSGSLQVGVTNRPIDAGSGQPSGPPADDAPLQVYGSGAVTIRLTPWLQGTAGVKLLPNGEIEVAGEIGLPSALTLFDEKALNKELLSLHLDIPLVGVAFAGQRIGIFATVGGSLSANASIGPGQLQQLALRIQYNPAHEDQTQVTGTAHLNVPAQAGLRLAVDGGVGVGIPLVSATAGLQVGGSLGLAGALDTEVTVNWNPTTGVKFDALGQIYVQPKFVFDVSAYAKVEAGIGPFSVDLYNRRWQLASFEYGSNLRFGVKFPVHYADGKPFNLSLSDVQFEVPQVDPMQMLGDMIRRVTG